MDLSGIILPVPTPFTEDVADLTRWRTRGDESFKLFTSDDFETLRGEFAAAERDHLLG